MKEVLVISGKGGSGKTTVCAALADLIARELQLVLVDADVDAANLELLTQPTQEAHFDFFAGKTAEIHQEICTGCGKCAAICRFDAILQENGNYFIDTSFCEGCMACVAQCPQDAIHMQVHKSGEWYRSATPYGTLFHAYLYPGAENSGKLVSTIKAAAREFTTANGSDLLLVDGPPGIGCPVTAALQGCDLALIVCEPTVSGLHDMERVQQAAAHFGVPSTLIINKYDLNQEIRERIKWGAEIRKVHLLGEIPYDERILAAISSGQPVTRVFNNGLRDHFEQIAGQLIHLISS